VNATISRERQRIHLQRCIESLNEFVGKKKNPNNFIAFSYIFFFFFSLSLVKKDISRNKGDVVMAAEQLRNAVKSLSLITGEISVDNLLDIVFNDFCIGK